MLKPRKRITKKKIKEDKLVTTYFKTLDFFKENSQKISIALIAMLAVVIIVVMIVRSKRTAELQASEQLAKANVAIMQTEHQEAIDILLSMVENYSGTKSAARGIYLLGKVYYAQEDYEKSLFYFKQYLDDYANDRILTSASYSGVGSSLEEQAKYAEAAEYYYKGATKFSDNFNAAQQLMDAARCYTLANQYAKAKSCYQMIIDEYEDGGLTSDAKLYLAKLNE